MARTGWPNFKNMRVQKNWNFKLAVKPACFGKNLKFQNMRVLQPFWNFDFFRIFCVPHVCTSCKLNKLWKYINVNIFSLNFSSYTHQALLNTVFQISQITAFLLYNYAILSVLFFVLSYHRLVVSLIIDGFMLKDIYGKCFAQYYVTMIILEHWNSTVNNTWFFYSFFPAKIEKMEFCVPGVRKYSNILGGSILYNFMYFVCILSFLEA